MAIQPPPISLFPSRSHSLLNNNSRDLFKSVQGNDIPMYQPVVDCDPVPAKTTSVTITNNNSEIGLTSRHIVMNPPLASRKSHYRCRDPSAELIGSYKGVSHQKTKFSGLSSSTGNKDIISLETQQEPSQFRRFIVEPTLRMRIELEERQRRQSRMMVEAIQEGIVKRLREKDDEIQRLGKRNCDLQEKVRSLCVENQIWRSVAQTNEATANLLRSNLEQVLEHVGKHKLQGNKGGETVAILADAESSCGSNDQGVEEELKLKVAVKEKGFVGANDI
ncbi:unnamed protein product [Linum trigynum]|uniref:Uncharacterized protein n=1 Tax=Linum trigynum TaxID=586398 RepID=A0AAV2FVK6_9ROSI